MANPTRDASVAVCITGLAAHREPSNRFYAPEMCEPLARWVEGIRKRNHSFATDLFYVVDMKADDHLRTVANQYAPVPERIDLPHISMSNLDALKERLAPIAGFTFEEYASNSHL